MKFDQERYNKEFFRCTGLEEPLALPIYCSTTPREEMIILDVLAAVSESDRDPQTLVDAITSIALLGIQRVQPAMQRMTIENWPLAFLSELCDFMLKERQAWTGDSASESGEEVLEKKLQSLLELDQTLSDLSPSETPK